MLYLILCCLATFALWTRAYIRIKKEAFKYRNPGNVGTLNDNNLWNDYLHHKVIGWRLLTLGIILFCIIF